MDRKVLFILLAVPLYFGFLHLVVLPLLQRLAFKIQGARFTYRLRPWEASKTTGDASRYDMYWSVAAAVISLCAVMALFGVVKETGLFTGLFER